MFKFFTLQKLNEISLQLSGEAAVQEKLDDLRVAAARSSPMMEVINLVWCICFLINFLHLHTTCIS